MSCKIIVRNHTPGEVNNIFILPVLQVTSSFNKGCLKKLNNLLCMEGPPPTFGRTQPPRTKKAVNQLEGRALAIPEDKPEEFAKEQ
jgi:hypothetical protein